MIRHLEVITAETLGVMIFNETFENLGVVTCTIIVITRGRRLILGFIIVVISSKSTFPSVHGHDGWGKGFS